MLFNGRTLIFTFSRTQIRIAEHERLQSLFKMSMVPPLVGWHFATSEIIFPDNYRILDVTTHTQSTAAAKRLRIRSLRTKETLRSEMFRVFSNSCQRNQPPDASCGISDSAVVSTSSTLVLHATYYEQG